MIYLIDANVLITAQNLYYSIDAVPEFWEWLAHQAVNGTIKMPRETFDEVKDGGTDKEKDLLYEWIQATDVKSSLLLKEKPNPHLVRQVTEQGYASDLTDVEVEKIGRDPFLIAYGLTNPADRIVVTTETSEPRKQRANRKIPDVCAQFGVTCIDTHQMTKTLKFATNWKAN